MRAVRLAAAVVSLAVSFTVASSGAGASKDITAATAVALRSWVQAVKAHTPGRADAPVITVAALSYKTREDLNGGMGLFLTVLMGKKYDTGTNEAAKIVAQIGHEAGNPDAASFLKQAAVLHSDVAAYGDLFPAQSTDSTGARPPQSEQLRIDSNTGMPTNTQRDEPVPPLLTNNRIILDKDGQILGEVVASWNWPFARSLLDLVRADDPFVSAWYHATTAYMFASGLYGDATPHLQRAAEVLPNDARMLFDRGCYAEILGLPMHQALLSEHDIVAQRAGSRHPGADLTWTTPSSSTPLHIPSAEKTNAEAERLYRRALAIDPSLVEARVRLARLLDLRRRHEEAAAELKAALAGNPSGAVAFYAHLFAGRAAQAMGRTDEASRHYQDAAALFPDAQSALLASSQLALLESDVPATLAPVQRLGERSGAFTADPWWQYHLGAGRDAEDLLKALWASVPR